MRILHHHIGAVMQNRAKLSDFRQTLYDNPELRQQAEERLRQVSDEDVRKRCWISRQNHEILTKALGGE